jgi:ubiquinone/menaquinone biosynthesis C-methylase UbiE
MSVLDIGCGDGRTARTLARSAASVIGLDPDTKRIESARAADPEEGSTPVEYLCEDAVTFDFPDASFDAVIFTRSL